MGLSLRLDVASMDPGKCQGECCGAPCLVPLGDRRHHPLAQKDRPSFLDRVVAERVEGMVAVFQVNSEFPAQCVYPREGRGLRHSQKGDQYNCLRMR